MEEEKKKEGGEERVAIHWGPNYIRIGAYFWKGSFPRNRCIRRPISRPKSHVFIHVTHLPPLFRARLLGFII